MAYRKLNPLLWDDEWFVNLPDFERTVWLAVLTGPQVRQIPGLMVATAATIADYLRREATDVANAIARFVADGRVEVDARARMLRVVNAPRWAAEHGEPENPNVIKGWWRAWKELPTCDLKRRHARALREAFVIARDRAAAGERDPEKAKSRVEFWNATWAITFGTVPPETVSEPSSWRSDTVTQTVPELPELDPGNGLGNPLACVRARQEQEQEHLQEPEQEQEPSRASARTTPTPKPSPKVLEDVQDYDGMGGRGDRVFAILRESPEVAAMTRDGQLDLRGIVRDLLSRAGNCVMSGKASEDEADERLDSIATDLARVVSAAARTAKPMLPLDVARKAGTFAYTTFGKSREEWRSRRPPARPAPVIQRGGWSREDAERNRPVLGEGDEV